ncbi:MAG: hypothetical protein ACI8QS_000240 [Planctomycetota bacterium]
MNRRQQIALLCACFFVAALEIPRAVQQVRIDLAGPYALPQSASDARNRLVVESTWELGSREEAPLAVPIELLEVPPVAALIATR